MPTPKKTGGSGGAGAGNRIDRRALAETIAARTTGVTEGQVYELLGTFGDVVTENLQHGNTVSLTGFGTFKPIDRAARTGMDVRTRKPIQIPARRAAAFTVGNTLREAMTYGGGSKGGGSKGGGGGGGGAKNTANTATATARTGGGSGGGGGGGRKKAG